MARRTQSETEKATTPLTESFAESAQAVASLEALAVIVIETVGELTRKNRRQAMAAIWQYAYLQMCAEQENELEEMRVETRKLIAELQAVQA